MADDLSKILANVDLKEVKVDSEGRIRIDNPDIAKKLAEMKGVLDMESVSDSLNTGTCNNTACFAPQLDELARRR